MLVIVSDIHLTDGTSGETIHNGAFAAFRERLRDLAYDASHRADGHYAPIEQLDVVLLGDILDVIRSSKWLDGDMRPWSDINDSRFAAKVGQIVTAILDQNEPSLHILRSLSDGKTITIPPATADGKVALVSREPDAAERRPVKVDVHYVVGNHDWFFHLPGEAFNSMRKCVVQKMALCHPPDSPFPHEPEESGMLMQAYRAHSVFARHGDIFDGFNYEHDRNASSLGDAIVVELLNRFPHLVKSLLGNQLSPECLAGLNEIDNVRPTLIVPIWVDALLKRTCQDAGLIKKVKGIWDDLVDEFLKIDFVRHRPWVKRTELEIVLKFSRGASFRRLGDFVESSIAKRIAREGAFYPNAFTEQTFRDRTARYFVYGHTHHHEIVPLDQYSADGTQLTQMYINSGTWRAVHDQAMFRPNEQEFADFHVMTYLAFFKPDERKGRGFETWSGALGKS